MRCNRADPDLSIVVPAYQEAALIETSLHAIADALDDGSPRRVEVVVVVADSPDGTAACAHRAAHRFADFRLIDAGPRAGKGRDVRLGMLAARGSYRLFMDADLATPLGHLARVAELMAADADLAIAVRRLSQAHSGLKRRLLAVGGNQLIQRLLLPGITDTQCGFKLFRADVAEHLFGASLVDGWGFDLEVLALARRAGYGIVTIDVPDWSDPKLGDRALAGDHASHAAAEVLRDLMRIRSDLRRGRRAPMAPTRARSLVYDSSASTVV